jgi:hypothetical protein
VADLRVRAALEKQVAALTETKADAAAFTKQLHDLGAALKGMVRTTAWGGRGPAVSCALRLEPRGGFEPSMALGCSRGAAGPFG